MHLKIRLRTALVSGATLVASVAMAASADTLATLGGAVGWAGPMRWGLPVSIDLLALVSGLTWLAPRLPKTARHLGQGMTLLTVAGSMILNATGHLVSAGDIVVGPPLIIAVSAVPPLAAALAVHLAARVAQRDSATIDTASDLRRIATDTGSVSDRKPSVPVAVGIGAGPVRSTQDGTGDDTETPADTVRTESADTAVPPIVPNAGGRMSETELDAVIILLAGETDPPRSYRAMEERFRELGYVASAARLRVAWNRLAVSSS